MFKKITIYQSPLSNPKEYKGPLGSYLSDIDWNQLETFELANDKY